MDGPQESIAVAYVAPAHDADVTFVGTSGSRQVDIDQLMRTLHSKAPHLVFVYEAGPCGYWRYRSLTKQGHRCYVVAPLGRLDQELQAQVKAWRLHPVVEALQALRGVQFIGAITTVVELGDLTRFEDPRQLMKFLGLTPSAYSRLASLHRHCPPR
jgi:transposase